MVVAVFRLRRAESTLIRLVNHIMADAGVEVTAPVDETTTGEKATAPATTPVNIFGKKTSTSFMVPTSDVEKGKSAAGKLGKQGTRWGLVRSETGIKFDSWDMALSVVDAGFRGALAREVQRQVEKKIPDNPYAKVFLVFVSYWALFFMIRGDMAPPDSPELPPGFAVVLIWCCSTLGGKAMGKIGMPGLLGNLLSGIILKNAIPYPGGGFDYAAATCGPPPGCSASSSGSVATAGRMLAAGGIDYSNPQWCVPKSINGLPNEWASDIITIGLTIIFMRGGLELDLELVKKAGAAAIRLTVMPGVCEALMVAIFSTVIFGMPFILGLSLGFILAAVSPAVVVGAMFDLKKKGYGKLPLAGWCRKKRIGPARPLTPACVSSMVAGVKQNIPTLVVAAASMDDVVAISGFAICVAFAIPTAGATTTTTIINAVHGPITLISGATLGLIGGNICAMTKVWDKHWKRVAVVAVQGFFLSFGAKTLEREWVIDGAHPIGASTGILGALSMAGVTSYMWERGKGFQSSGKEKHYAHDVEATLAQLWSIVAQPLLFGVVGSYLDFRRMPGVTIAKAILTVRAMLPLPPPRARYIDRPAPPHHCRAEPTSAMLARVAGGHRRLFPHFHGLFGDVQGRSERQGADLCRALVAAQGDGAGGLLRLPVR